MAKNVKGTVSFTQAFAEADQGPVEGGVLEGPHRASGRPGEAVPGHAASRAPGKPAKDGRVVEGKEERGGLLPKNFYIFADQEKPLIDQAYAEKRASGGKTTVSSIVRKAIDEYLERHKDVREGL